MYYGQNITDNLTHEEEDEWFKFLRGIREFARRNMLNFDTRDITRSNLDISDIRQQSKADSTYSAHEIDVTESVIVESMYGSRINSYEDRGPVKIRIKHSDFIDPEKRGSRARKIECIYLETHRGERFLLEHNNLHYARAMARHLSEGNVMHDDLGQHITSIAEEMAHMSHFVRGVKHRQFEDRETQDMVKSALKHYEQKKDLLRRLRKTKDYREYAEMYMPENAIEDDIDVNKLRERFVKKVYNDKFDEALPYVARAYYKEQAAMETAMAEEFAAWAQQVDEDTWDFPDTDSEQYDLGKIMSNPLTVGIDGLDAISSLNSVIGDDELNQQFANLAAEEGPDADARPLVLKWLQSNDPELAAEFEKATQNNNKQPNQTTGPSAMDRPNVYEDDHLGLIRRLAGLAKNN